MTQATAKITDQFKRRFIRCYSAQHFVRTQEMLFKLGFRWHNLNDREVRNWGSRYLFIDQNCEILHGHSISGSCADFTQISEAELELAVAEVRRIKREESKASKKRRAQRKWDATATKRTTEVCPVRENVLVAVRLNNGNTYTGEAGGFSWTSESPGWTHADIESYKVLKPNKHKPVEGKAISVDQLVTGIAKSLGREVAVPVESMQGSEALRTACNTVLSFEREPAPVGDVNSEARGSGARFNAGKPDYSLIPMSLLEGEARVWAYGAKKYAAWNWMKGMDWNVPFACAMRHLAAWQRGEDIDPETGESHLDHAMCNLRMLRYYADFYKEGDNRPKQFFALEQK